MGTSSIRSRLRQKPPLAFDKAVSLSTHSTSFSRNSNSGPLLSYSYTAGKGDVLMTTVDEDTTSSNKASFHKKTSTTNSNGLFGVDLTTDNIAVAMVYFVQGVLGLSRLAINFYLKDDLHLDRAELLS